MHKRHKNWGRIIRGLTGIKEMIRIRKVAFVQGPFTPVKFKFLWLSPASFVHLVAKSFNPNQITLCPYE